MEADTSRPHIVMMPPLHTKLEPISLYISDLDCTVKLDDPHLLLLDDDLAAAATGGGGGTFFYHGQDYCQQTGGGGSCLLLSSLIRVLSLSQSQLHVFTMQLLEL